MCGWTGLVSHPRRPVTSSPRQGSSRLGSSLFHSTQGYERASLPNTPVVRESPAMRRGPVPGRVVSYPDSISPRRLIQVTAWTHHQSRHAMAPCHLALTQCKPRPPHPPPATLAHHSVPASRISVPPPPSLLCPSHTAAPRSRRAESGSLRWTCASTPSRLRKRLAPHRCPTQRCHSTAHQ
jgi:hypothetical protein